MEIITWTHTVVFLLEVVPTRSQYESMGTNNYIFEN